MGAATGEDRTELKSFYVATHVVSDASPFRYEYILDLSPEGNAVKVRNIRIAPSASGCRGNLSVKAVDRNVAQTTPQRIAHITLCSMNPNDVAAAIKRSTPRGLTTIDDTAGYTIVAHCSTSDKVFDLPFPEEVDFKTLKRISPQAASLWDLAGQVSERAFGKNFSFHNASPSEDASSRELGAQVVSDLKSGAYSQAFDKNDLEKLLTDYSGAGEEVDPWLVELIAPGSAEWTQYQLPKYPPLARQTRIQGEVRLVATVDVQSGFVREVKILSGNPLLTQSAISAVKGWQFRQSNPPEDSVEISMKFEFRCP
jgi:TonB family protein